MQVATEAITEYTKEVEGKSVPKWNVEEIEEIVIAQVRRIISSASLQVKMTNDLFIFQLVLFLLAGFDTTATTLTNIVFLLALNPEVQSRLYDEIAKKMEFYVILNRQHSQVPTN